MTPLLFLRIYKGSQLVAVKQFPDEQIVMGQSSDVTLPLDGAGVALVHAVIENRNGQHFLGDLGSEGGTKLNGKPILDHVLNSGDEIEIGVYRIEFHVGLPKPKSTPPNMVKDLSTEKTLLTTPAVPPPLVVTPPMVRAPEKPSSQEVKPQESPSHDIRPQVVLPKDVLKPKDGRSQDLSQSRGAQSPLVSGSAGLGTFEEIRKIEKRQRANYGTYAPESSHKNLYDIVKPAKGPLIEVLVVWGERVMNTYQFEKAGVINVGSHPKNAIVLPVFGTSQISHPLIKIESLATVILTDSMRVELSKENETKKWSHEDLKRENRFFPSGVGFALALQQGEMAKIDFGNGLSVVVRYTTSPGKPLAAPFLDFTSSELVGLVTILAISAILGLYLLIYKKEDLVEEPKEPERIATFLTARKKRVMVEDQPAGIKSPTTEEKKLPQQAQEGAASDAAPNKSQSTEIKPTTPNPGNASGIQKGSLARPNNKPPTKEASGSTGPKAKDVTKTGLLSVFGKAGTQQALRNAEKGAGLVGGLGQSASGEGANVARGAGTLEGLGTKDLGKGGAGESTVGISGVQTKGRGGGNSGYGVGNLGDKGRAAVTVGGEGESFTGTIDKEGIRRVVRQNQREIQACYEKALNQDPGLSGKVVLEWEIGERGKVGAVKVLNSSLGNSRVEQCMIMALKRWTFPEPPPDQIAVVAFPFVFMSQN